MLVFYMHWAILRGMKHICKFAEILYFVAIMKEKNDGGVQKSNVLNDETINDQYSNHIETSQLIYSAT